MGSVVITGASSGFGRATAIAFRDAGYDVVAAMRDTSKGEDLGCRVLEVDVTSQESVDNLFAAVPEVDILVNNAGIPAPSACEQLPIEYVVKVMDTNYFGGVRCARAVLPQMRERGSGWIVNVTSMVGRSPKPLEAAYAASKAALESWAECLAGEMREFGVNVAIIEPGVIKTSLMGRHKLTPTGPYDRQWRRFRLFVLAQLRHAITADVVGATILEAVTTATPRLRWAVGPDAEIVVNRRPELSDEELVDLCAIADEDEYWAEYARLWGPDLVDLKLVPELRGEVDAMLRR
jgi:NAD(P)-dependent dehydrogenase (short-subunit alcohol dehydrogenase family)